MKENLNNSNNNVQHYYENIVRVKVTSKTNKTNFLEDGVYNETDNECEEDEVLTRIGRMENNAVQAITLGKSIVDTTMTNNNNKIVNQNSKSTNNSNTILNNDKQIVKYSNRSKNTNENNSQTLASI